ncbi:DUF421 domain-containing protein [Niallia taxi]|uniref:DUF421 domain-containing protein n=1 Tax=Niallia taxi TaxID=2499688 RepID=UPI0029344A4A|nr:DUF421 domain-containing protein [Niallia taxi]WOD63281.1 DUF421 domain-containing protein [Niallia taxi]
MDFHQGQETLTAIEWILRAIIAFFFLVIVGKLLGHRSISQLRMLDFVIALVIGNVIAHPLSEEKLGLKGSMLTTSVLVVLYIAGIKLMLKWRWFQKAINEDPITVVQNGKILYDGLKRARISIDILLGELRGKQVDSIKKVALATWEPDGSISVFLETKFAPVTPSSLQLETAPFELPITIIKDGRIDIKELERLHKQEEWVKSELKAQYQAKVTDILLATIDHQDNLVVFFYR